MKPKAALADQLGGGLVSEEESVEQPIRQPRLGEGASEALADQQCLRRAFKGDGVAGDERRDDGIDGGEVGVVPGRDDEHRADRLAGDITMEAVAVLDDEGSERVFRDRGHVGRPLLDAADLAAIAHRPAHLPGKLRHDLPVHRLQRGDGLIDDGHALRQGPRRPVLLRGFCLSQDRCSLVRCLRLAFRIDAAVNRRNAGQFAHCPSIQASSPRRRGSSTPQRHLCLLDPRFRGDDD